MRRDHREAVVGPWAAEKLDALEKYLSFYGKALSKQPFTRVYIDAFAGAPISRVRVTENTPTPLRFSDDADDLEGQAQFINGSPVRALGIDNPFHVYYFFDLDRSRAAELQALSQHDPSVHVEVGDCNPLLKGLAPELAKRRYRAVAFLDPYGAHLRWDTIEALAGTGTTEVVINFPVAMAINRLITRSGVIPESWSEQLDACFGTGDWRGVAYRADRDLFGNEIIAKNGGVAERLLTLYLDGLRTLFPCVAAPRLVRNTKGSPLYYLLWAGPNKLGLKVAEQILGQGERLR